MGIDDRDEEETAKDFIRDQTNIESEEEKEDAD